MAAAYEAERRAALSGGSMCDFDFMQAVAEYNQVDCRAMSEVVSWLRANR
jgi:predicted RecB family nuclease